MAKEKDIPTVEPTDTIESTSGVVSYVVVCPHCSGEFAVTAGIRVDPIEPTEPPPVVEGPDPPPETGSGTSVTLRWNPVCFSQGYVVEVGSRSGAADLLCETTTETQLAIELVGTKCYARVRSIGAMGGSGATNAGEPSEELVIQR